MGQRKYDPDDLARMRLRAYDRTHIAISNASDEAIEAGIGWYSVANAHAVDIAGKLDCSVARAAAIMAVLSPMVSWTNNLSDAYALAADNSPHVATYALGPNIDKARRLIGHRDFTPEHITDIIGGRKVNAFWLNISNPLHSSAVTLDTHMANLFGIDASDVFEIVGVYDALSLGVSDAAEVLGIRPCQAQAIAWLVQSGRDDARKSLPDPF